MVQQFYQIRGAYSQKENIIVQILHYEGEETHKHTRQPD